MDYCTEKVLESVTLKTLHAHTFSRSSSQAAGVLTDLLSRYIQLLAGTCAQYAQHAGRNSLTARDAIAALSELGVDVEELREYVHEEAHELAHYAHHAPKRVEDLADMRGLLHVLLRCMDALTHSSRKPERTAAFYRTNTACLRSCSRRPSQLRRGRWGRNN